MHRLVLVALLLAVPAVDATVTGFESQASLEPNSRASWPLDSDDGNGFLLSWSSNVAVDVLVIEADNAAVLDNGTPPRTAALLLNQSSGRSHVTLATPGPWLLVVDNTDRPGGGATGSQPATVQVTVAPPSMLPVPPRVTQPDSEEAPTLWNTLLFDAAYWSPVDVVGFGGVAMWMALFALAALYRFATPWPKVATLAGLVAAAVFLWALLPHPGVMTQVGLPMALGLGAGWLAVKGSSSVQDGARFALLATVVGTFFGLIVAYGVEHLWREPAPLVLGEARFLDALFVLPMSALLGVVLFKLVPDLVEAFEEASRDDAAPAEPAGPGQGDTFHVTCLRCQTEVKVDRSMKRFRVATDRFEFACPNCQYWMEWADPARPHGAAAA